MTTIPMFPQSRLPDAEHRRILAAIENVLLSGWLTPRGNPAITRFEQDLAGFFGRGHVVGTASGTMALIVALRLLAKDPGEVVTTSFSYAATAAAVLHAGHVPRFVDIDPDTLQGDERATLTAVTDSAVVAALPVHLYGNVCEWTEVRKLARERGAVVVDDSAQRLGPDPGLDSDAVCFSLGPTKSIMGVAEAGAIACADPCLADRARILLHQGDPGGFRHIELGYNGVIDATAAAVCRSNLGLLPAWDRRRDEIFARYASNLGDAPLLRLPRWDKRGAVSKFCVIVEAFRDELAEHLTSRGIDAQVHYPRPLHLQPCFAGLGHGPGDFPVTEEMSRKVLTLPAHHRLTDSEVDQVCEETRAFVNAVVH